MNILNEPSQGLEVSKTEHGFEFYLNGDKLWCSVHIYPWTDAIPPDDKNGMAHVEFSNEFSIGVYQLP